jgi:hypothetical protein
MEFCRNLIISLRNTEILMRDSTKPGVDTGATVYRCYEQSDSDFSAPICCFKECVTFSEKIVKMMSLVTWQYYQKMITFTKHIMTKKMIT